MRARAPIVVTTTLLLVLPLAIAMQQAAPNANQSQSHSGIDEGKNGPKSPTPVPPAQPATNPENPDANGGKLQTLTGVVSDSFCGRHHYQLTGATPAECTRYCLAHRGTFALVVGDKVYTLQNRPGHTLDELAGQQARVTGVVHGDVVEIQSVGPAGKTARTQGH